MQIGQSIKPVRIQAYCYKRHRFSLLDVIYVYDARRSTNLVRWSQWYIALPATLLSCFGGTITPSQYSDDRLHTRS